MATDEKLEKAIQQASEFIRKMKKIRKPEEEQEEQEEEEQS
jgi:Sec-independent protein translocase protein TatA